MSGNLKYTSLRSQVAINQSTTHKHIAKPTITQIHDQYYMEFNCKTKTVFEYGTKSEILHQKHDICRSQCI